MSTSNVDTNINNVETPLILVPESTTTVPLEVHTIESNIEENRTLNIPGHTSNMYANVNMCDKSTTDTSIVLPPPNSPLRTSFIPLTYIPLDYPTYNGILNQPIATLFSYQSTDHYLDQGKDASQNMEDDDEEGFGFRELTIDPG
ncbi:unnamed protein product [Lactuca saligna]|uniref:Uncharacterized protein n=1 Tax=Lactuca saligna TaxID=75948 RepID=A0AA35ZSF4_LACSI|nr:unnamed protein product [Lactuca saligna]